MHDKEFDINLKQIVDEKGLKLFEISEGTKISFSILSQMYLEGYYIFEKHNVDIIEKLMNYLEIQDIRELLPNIGLN